MFLSWEFCGDDVNGEDRRRKVAFLLLALAAVITVASAAFAVQITLNESDIAQLGGTGQVDVSCPANPCEITRVTWTLSGTPPRVTQVNVKWTPASSSEYKVYVTLYKDASTIVGSGSATQSGSSSPVTTPVPVSPVAPYTSIDPKDVYKVEIVIVQEFSD
jgi:hypothetical protein